MLSISTFLYPCFLNTRRSLVTIQVSLEIPSIQARIFHVIKSGKDRRLFVPEPISTARKQGKFILEMLTQALCPNPFPLAENRGIHPRVAHSGFASPAKRLRSSSPLEKTLDCGANIRFLAHAGDGAQYIFL